MKSFIILFLLVVPIATAQNSKVKIMGTVSANGNPVPYASVYIKDGSDGTNADANGNFEFETAAGILIVIVQSQGFKAQNITVDTSNEEIILLNFVLEESDEELEQVVITGTRTKKRRIDSPVIVNLINSETLENVVATDLSEGLRFQPGLRVEKDCQTCNYTQIRLNGLQGGYSQVLINGRPIFSPLTGLYGLEQIPVNMIERIEVVRGGISALYGSSAIGGTVNVITKIPKQNNYSLAYTYENIDGNADQNIINGNATVVSKNYNAGANFFVSNRQRKAYDANDDNFSEMPELKDNSFGMNAFYLPSENSKLEFNFSSLYEYRFGGEMVEKPAYLAQQAEERTHNILMGGVDYQINFNENKSSFILYYGGQRTNRDHYTGIIPDTSADQQEFFAAPPYGISKVYTHQGGAQFNNRFDEFFTGTTVLTGGIEYTFDDVFDQILSYNYLIDQTTKNLGAFVQNDWNITENLNFLSGFRIDKHNLLNHAIFSPRLSLLYKMKETTQFRLGWGTGFRAPQAFDTDLHIAFAGGGVSRISLANGLMEEKSNSFTASVNYDKASEHFIGGFTLEGFYTHLDNAFYLFPIGEDEFGDLFEKRNGSGATVSGITVEARANFDYLVEVDAGFTFQKSLFDEAIENINGLPLKREFLRTPNHYGYATLTYAPTKKFGISANLVFTGPMDILHLAGENTGQEVDEYYKTKSFTEISFRMGYTFSIPKVSTGLELFGGIKNITNSYQNDFDIGKNRDSNYVYGPGSPRAVFFGLKIQSL
ncbi:TonB-dependent receptor [Aequorivita sp. SDUM287046]|uniref:TonB-dependent receptor n=1 Tax=Aequorivita aurantiaca TaxID=3053356 RepID=A0ABT8DF01_9FLAO|nr:TonB-dependent receptor [Aequorivita aurantiaca]MDN3723189.1 TonB-dependent receptor [Aequorivita aurantiaca]